MSKTYEQLITEINEVTAEVFNGRSFERIEPVEDGEVWPITSGSERRLGGYDEDKYYEIDVVEQHVMTTDVDGESVPRHYLQVAWRDEDEMVTLDLDEGRINDPYDETYSDDEAMYMARHILYLLDFVRLDTVQTVPENDLSRFEPYLAEAAIFSEIERSELGSIRIGAAATDTVVGFVARHELNGDEFPEHLYDRMVARLRKVYSLSEDEVDEAIDLRMLEMERAEKSSSGDLAL